MIDADTALTVSCGAYQKLAALVFVFDDMFARYAHSISSKARFFTGFYALLKSVISANNPNTIVFLKDFPLKSRT